MKSCGRLRPPGPCTSTKNAARPSRNQIVLVLVLVLIESVCPELSLCLLDVLSWISSFFLTSTRTKRSSTSTKESWRNSSMGNLSSTKTSRGAGAQRTPKVFRYRGYLDRICAPAGSPARLERCPPVSPAPRTVTLHRRAKNSVNSYELC